ncbi:MAG TPA: hypothetical protein VFQ50_07100, partial [Flavobacterium sp.]|jgi:hypothetical protein|nr:hypothetical protein [Flavobacterium sp.]
MKNNLLKLYVLTFVLFSDFVMFAQDPGDDTGGGDLEEDDAPEAPINGKLIYLAIAGILFAVYTYRRNKKIA